MKSDPSATGSSRSASATAAPPLLPPALTEASQALGVGPNSGLKVCDPSPNSGMLVLPTTMQPAAFMRATYTLSTAGRAFFSSGEPKVVAKPGGVARVLDGLRHAVQPAQRLAARQLRVAFVGLAQQHVVIGQVDDGVGARVQRVDAGQVGLHHLAAAGVDGLADEAGDGRMAVWMASLSKGKDLRASRSVMPNTSR
jgi:hypothetical protein